MEQASMKQLCDAKKKKKNHKNKFNVNKRCYALFICNPLSRLIIDSEINLPPSDRLSPNSALLFFPLRWQTDLEYRVIKFMTLLRDEGA